LGLAICRKLVDAMGGRISVESVPNKGSLFWFLVPLPEEKPRITGPVPDAVERAERLRILVAEDNPVNQKVIMHMVQKLGHHGTLVSNGAEAVAVYRQQTFDLVLMDCQMPEMDGFEAARIIRESGGNAPIIAVTANAFAEDREKCLRAGMTDHVSKPVQARTLETVINRSMGILKECGLPPAEGSSHSLESLLEQVQRQQQYSGSAGEAASAARLIQNAPVSFSGDLHKI
jgi:CheY-like chemotaxis protein